MLSIKPNYKKGDIIIKNNSYKGYSYISSYDKSGITKYTIRKVVDRGEHYVYGFNEVHNYVYNVETIEREFDLYDNCYIRKEKLKKIKKIVNEENRPCFN
jgi:hypothetical protein